METETMGRVLTEATIENMEDLWAAKRSLMQADQVRSVTVNDALVDTGATLLSMPTRLIKQLGLEKTGAKRITSSIGVGEAAMYGAVRLTIQGRTCTMDVMEVPDSVPVLIGQLPLEHLDFVVDLRSHRLIGNPAHGGEHMYELFRWSASMADPAKNPSGLTAEGSAVPTTFADDPKRQTRRWRRLLLRGSACLAFLVIALIGVYFYRWYVVESALQDAIAEADRLDPGWRLAELEAKRVAIPVDRNSAPLVREAGGEAIVVVRKGNSKALFDAEEILWQLSPRIRLAPNQTELLRKGMTPFAAPLLKGRKIADFANGRYPFDTSPPFIGHLPHWEDAANIYWLLACEAALQIEDGDFDRAWACARAIQNVGRSNGDEPTATAQRERAWIGKVAIGLMERTLAHGSVSADKLAECQERLREELKHPALLIGLRGDRAYLHHVLSELEAGEIRMTDLKGRLDPKNAPSQRVKVKVHDFLSSHEAKPAHAWLLRHATQAVEIAKLPEKDAYPALQKLELAIADAPELARQLLPKSDRFDLLWSERAVIGCAYAGLATERYRLKHDRWPTELADLVAERLLDAVPADPYDGKPLRYRKTADGVVIYSVGPSGNGKGDDLDANPPNVKDERVEFRLWDADKR